jgi:exodeoxyribonuclease VII large subunit
MIMAADANPTSVHANPDVVLSVSQAIERFARESIGIENLRLYGITVTGTVVRFTRHHTRHVYLTLTDGVRQLEVFVHRGDARRLAAGLDTGRMVQLTGRLSLYGAVRTLQCHTRVVRLLPKAAEGQASLSFPALHAPESREGSHESAIPLIATRRRPIPELPEIIGIVTAPGSAALRDILGVVQQCAPWVEVIFAPSMIQGQGAPASIVSAIQRLSKMECDIILLTRGGADDGFAPFNDGRVASTIAACPTPVATALGHAGDHTLACKIADASFDTPTAAAYELTRAHARQLPTAQPVDQALADLETGIEEALDHLRKRLYPLQAAMGRLIKRAQPVSPVVIE